MLRRVRPAMNRLGPFPRATNRPRARQVVSSDGRPAALRVRGMAGAVKVQETGLDDVIAPYEVARTEPLHEMGVLYPPGVPSPMEAVLADPPIIVDGLLAKTGKPGPNTNICARTRPPPRPALRRRQAVAPQGTRSSTSDSARTTRRPSLASTRASSLSASKQSTTWRARSVQKAQ